MSFDKRIADVEDNLTPKEAVIYWMREAHRCDSLLTYGRWLMDQPEDAYPLIRLPKQVVAAIRARNKGTPDLRLGDQFYRVQKDVFFLYYLHNQVNLRALEEEEALRLKVTLLSEKLRSLIRRIPVREKTPDELDLDLDEAIDAWPLEEPTVESADHPGLQPDPAPEERPDTGRTARTLAEHHVLMARAEALDALGERDAGTRLVEDWMRSRDS